MFYGKKPNGATYYAREGKFEFVAWGAPMEPGDKLCLGLTGRTENQLVRDILDGKYNHIFEKGAAANEAEADPCLGST